MAWQQPQRSSQAELEQLYRDDEQESPEEKFCAFCGDRIRGGHPGVWASRKYCSRICNNRAKGRTLDDVHGLYVKDDTSGCWQWIGAKDASGYGNLHFGGRNWGAHRLIFTLLVGPVAEGLEIDHLCRNRLCVNPDHLEPVTHAENMRRSRGKRPPKTHCVNGHPMTPSNVRITSQGWRSCRTCIRASSARRYARNKGRKAA